MKDIIVDRSLSNKVIMTGVKYKDNHPGGISSVVKYWSKHIDGLQYYAEFKEGTNIGKILIFIKAICLIFLKLSFDIRVKIVHVHTAETTDFKRNSIIIKIAKLFNKKVVLHSHGATFVEFYNCADSKGKLWIKNILGLTDKIIVLSESWKLWYESIGIEKEKLIILHNITEYPHIISIPKNESKIRLLFLGEIGIRKGVFDILKALHIHRDEIIEKLELHIGGNKMEEELIKKINEYGLQKIVFFDGFVSGENKIKLLNWANVFILPSFNEGLPISILEAMSYKLPIISSSVGGIPEVVDSTNGILVEPGNSEEIFQAINMYIKQKELLLIHGNCSYRKVATYLPDYVLNHLKHIYIELLNEK